MYEVRILPRAVKDIRRLPQGYSRLVSQQIDELGVEPRSHDSRKLRGRADYRVRVGVYRILYEIDDEEKSVTVYRVKHRREAYR